MADCLAVRERLTEHAVSTLPKDDRRFVERHLEWCAGCRKEARELREAAAMVGLSLGQAQPPPELEERVVRRLRAAGRKGPSRRRVRVRRSLTLLAAVVGLLGIGLAGALFARQQNAEDRLSRSQRQAQEFALRLERLLNQFPDQTSHPHAVTRATLTPTPGTQGGGGAIRLVSPRFEDIALVRVGGMHQRTAPYRVWLTRVSGRRLFVGTIARLDSGGAGDTENEFTTDLRLYRYVEVRDAKGRLVLRGAFTSSA